MSESLTASENGVLQHLADAWNGFAALGSSTPQDADEFMRAIHQAQAIIALRVARRTDPHIWRQP